MSTRGYIAVISLACLLSGCGTYVPSIRDGLPNDDLAESTMITRIIQSVACELSYTVTGIVRNDRAAATNRVTGKTYTDFLRDWGAQVALNLTIYERTGVNPSILLTPPSVPSSIFTVAGGLSASAESYRLQKINFFYTMEELNRPDLFRKGVGPEACRDPTGDKQGSLLVDSDLRLMSLFEGRLGATTLAFAGSPGDGPVIQGGEKNVLSQTVSFKVLTSGTVTPAWKLVRASVNPSGDFLSTGRDRTHELVFTFGPLDKSVRGRRSLTPLAQQTHLDTQLQSGIRNSLVP